MKTPEEKKAIALALIAPDYKDPSTCGWDEETRECAYEAENGNRCVVGSCMTDAILEKRLIINNDPVELLIEMYGEDKIFKAEYTGIFSRTEWGRLQAVHDSIAKGHLIFEPLFERLGLFTLPELEEYRKAL